MAITATHYRLFKSLPLPQGGSLLEIGEANWYGDLDPREAADLSGLDPGSDTYEFDICKRVYAAIFSPSRFVAIDQGGATAVRLDLNKPLGYHTALVEYSPNGDPLIADRKFDVIINHGTAEHIFNIAQVFRTMHDACAEGGLMVHDSPFTGWIDHGFYCLHPTLFYDLAAANCYEIVKVAIHTIEGQQIIPLEGRDHVAKLAQPCERWTAYGGGNDIAVIRCPKSGHGPPTMSQLRGKAEPNCSNWLKAWCPTWEIAEAIAAAHNRESRIPNNSQLFVALRKMTDKPFKVPMQGVYSGALSAAGKQAWERLR